MADVTITVSIGGAGESPVSTTTTQHDTGLADAAPDPQETDREVTSVESTLVDAPGPDEAMAGLESASDGRNDPPMSIADVDGMDAPPPDDA